MRGKEIELLRWMKKNSRASLTEISEKTGTPISTLFEMLKRLQKEAIKKHVSMLDYPKLGYSLIVHLNFQTKQKEKTIAFLKEHPNVNTTYSTINGPDLYVECIFKELKEFVEFKEALERYDLEELQEHFVIEELKREEFSI